MAPDRFEHVAIEPLVLPSLPEEAGEARVARHRFAGQLPQLGVGSRGPGHQVGPVVQETHVEEPGHGVDASVQRHGLGGPRKEFVGEPGRRKRVGEVGEPAGSGEFGCPHHVDGEDVEVVGPAFQRGHEHLPRRVGGVGQRLGAQKHVRILATEAIEEGVERRRIAPQRLVLENERYGARGRR